MSIDGPDIRAAFGAYVAAGFDETALPALCTAFRDAAQWDEALLLGNYLADGAGSTIIDIPQSLYVGRRAWLGPEKPVEGAVGDIWYDTRENVASILTPAESYPWLVQPPALPFDPFRSWIAVRPVRGWQFGAWKAATMPDNADPKDALPLVPVTGIPLVEARQYAAFFGKDVPGFNDWVALPGFLSPMLLEAFWEGGELEWSGTRSYVDEDYDLAVTPSTIESDPDDELAAFQHDDVGDPIGRIVFPRGTAPPAMGFRTCAAR